jgi:hypothetical protein
MRRVCLLTTISSLPVCAARCRLVLLLSLKSGFCKMPGLEWMMRLTSKASDKSIALLSLVDASIILATARSNHGVKISNCLSRHIVLLLVVDAGGKQTDGYD